MVKKEQAIIYKTLHRKPKIEQYDTLITKLPKVTDNHNICNATGATSGVGTSYPSGAPDCTPGF
jgi:hypothetical protein